MSRTPTRIAATLAVLPVLAAISPAQDVAAQAAQAQANQRLAKALSKMSEQESCGFSTKLSWQQGDGPNARGAQVLVLGAAGRIVRPGTVEEIRGAWTGELLAVECNDDDQVVFAGRRQVARQGKGAWKLRGDRLASGSDLPYVLDPQLLFDRLRSLEVEVARAEVGTWNDRPIEILTVTVEGDDAVELVWSGALPEQGGGLNAVMVMAGGGGKPAVPKPEVTIDLAFFVDPATQLVHELKVRSYSKGGGLAGRVIALGGGAAGGFQIEEEKEEEEDEPQQPGFENGLPVRKVEDRVLQKLDIRFTDHGKAELPELDETARRLLGLK